VQGAVEPAVAAAVEAVADGLAGAGLKRGDAGETGEGGLAAQPAGMRPGDEQLRGRDRPDAWLSEQCRREPLDERCDLPLEGGRLARCRLDPAGAVTQREQDRRCQIGGVRSCVNASAAEPTFSRACAPTPRKREVAG
jgi:hypothetical protein